MARVGQLTMVASNRYGPLSLPTMVLMPSENSQAATIVSESFPVGPEFLRSDRPG
jgi:hypothetical protein